MLLLFPVFIFWCLRVGSDLRTDDGKLAETPLFVYSLIIVTILDNLSVGILCASFKYDVFFGHSRFVARWLCLGHALLKYGYPGLMNWAMRCQKLWPVTHTTLPLPASL